jgi:hypothetical protein
VLCRSEWQTWTAKYSKQYSSVEEASYRKLVLLCCIVKELRSKKLKTYLSSRRQLFEDNAAMIRAHNAQADASFTMGECGSVGSVIIQCIDLQRLLFRLQP